MVSMRGFHGLSVTLALAGLLALAGTATAQDTLATDSLTAGDTLAAGTRVGPPPPAPRDYVAQVRAAFTADNRAYSEIRTVLAFVSPAWDLIIAMVILFSGLSAALRNVACNMGRRLYVRVLVFFVLYTIVLFVLGFPLSYYAGYALEHQYGLSNQTFGDWFGEQAKSAAVNVIVFGVIPILWLGYKAIARWPRHWWLPVAAGTLPLIVAGTLLQPLVIDPLYNKFTPLRDQHLKARLLDLAARAEIPGRNIYQVDKSAQTNKYNAYVNGFGASQRIVLWDTILQGMQEDEILFVMGHEMGHYKLGHIWKGIAAFSLGSFVLLFLAARIAGWTVARFGPLWGISDLADVASMPLLAATLTLLSLFAAPVINGISRGIEHEADVFAVEVTRDNDAGARAFLKLGAQNRSNPEPSRFIAGYLYTHPPLMERIRFTLGYKPWLEGKPNRVFHGRPAPR
ncbi:MAG TPA: M48 family metallopeptidase [Candidatus Eisenbacteria bacterium]|nr:M48 family metallopeptidase [Candidatus Eisenbacteria bacterium]